MKILIKHARLISYLLIALVCVLEIILLIFDVLNPALVMLLCFVFYLCAIVLINLVSIKYLQRIAKEFSESCEPSEYCETLRLFHKGNPKSIPNQINYAVSLIISDTNNFEQARMIMETIDVNKIPEKSVGLRHIYYNNLCSIYTHLNEIEKAEASHLKAIEYYNKIKTDKEKAQHVSRIALLTAELQIKKGDYDKALLTLEDHKEITLYDKISHSVALGEIYLNKNEIEKAREKLSYAIEHGSKICDGQRAKALLEKLSWFYIIIVL